MESGVLANIRPILPSDAPLLVEGLGSLSEESRFARFGIGLDHLSRSELEYLTRVDHRDHVAMGALVGDVPAGVGRYVLIPDSNCAEVALAVVDEFQGRGLGRELFEALAAIARHDGVEFFCFEVAESNDRVRQILNHLEVEITAGLSDGRVELAELPDLAREKQYIELIELYRSE